MTIDHRTVYRRRFLKGGGAMMFSAGVASAVGASLARRLYAATDSGLAPPPGIQLFTLLTPLVRDFGGTLTSLGRMGYREVEMVGLLGHDAAAFRHALDAAGLSAPSLHIVSKAAQDLFLAMASGTMPSEEAWPKIDAAMDLAGIEEIMHFMFGISKVMGNRYLVLAAADSSLFQSQAGIDRVVAAYTKAGDMCHERGLTFAFHPHLEEFHKVDGTRAVDRILDRTDPNKVFIELDFFWAAMAHVDIPEFLERYRGRFRLGHVKDVAKGTVVPPDGFANFDAVPTAAFEDVGYGTLDYARLIPLARQAGMLHFFVERDEAPDPLDSARRSLPNLRTLLKS